MKKGVLDIVGDYREAVVEAGEEECQKPDFQLDKTKLEKLSDRLLKIILEAEGGRSLDSMASLDEED